MYRAVRVLVVTMILAAAPATAQSSRADSLAQLDWLQGTWDYRDASVDAATSYADAGERTCQRALRDAYIRCESVGRTANGERRYLFYINWNGNDRRYEMVALFSDYGRKVIYELRLSDGGRRIDLLAPRFPTASGGTSQSWATITFDGDRTASWETRINTNRDLPDHWPVRFREQAVRR